MRLQKELCSLEVPLDRLDEEIDLKGQSEKSAERDELWEQVVHRLRGYGGYYPFSTKPNILLISEGDVLQGHRAVFNYDTATARHVDNLARYYHDRYSIDQETAIFFRDSDDVGELQVYRSDSALERLVSMFALKTCSIKGLRWVRALESQLPIHR